MAEPTRCTRHLQGQSKRLLINEPRKRASRQAGGWPGRQRLSHSSAGQGAAPEVCDFSRIQLSKARHDTLWADQHVAWHYRLQVHCRRGLGPITMCSSTGRTSTGPSQQRTKGKAVLRRGEDLVTVNLPRPKQVLLHYGHRVLMLSACKACQRPWGGATSREATP